MKEITLEVNKRDDHGKGVARKLRAAGRIPAVAYGKEHDPIPLDIEYEQFRQTVRTLQGENALYNLNINGQTDEDKALIRDIQRDPVHGSVLHIDFQYIKMDENIRMSVPVKLHGTSIGVKNTSGVLQWKHRALDLTALPHHIPDSIDIDISELNIGDAIHASDLEYPKVNFAVNEMETIVSIIAPKVSQISETEEGEEGEEGAEGAEAVVETDEAAEPEVISEKKAGDRKADKNKK